MPVEKESKLAQWIAALREGWPAVRAGVDEWTGAVREHPALIWATPAVRYAVYGLGALLAMWLLTWGVGQFQPPEAAPPAATADFHVLCTVSGCRHHFIINKEFGFDDFPMRCPKCGKVAGQRAVRCASKTCRRRWVVPKVKDNEYRCPYCGGFLGEAR